MRRAGGAGGVNAVKVARSSTGVSGVNRASRRCSLDAPKFSTYSLPSRKAMPVRGVAPKSRCASSRPSASKRSTWFLRTVAGSRASNVAA